MLRELAEHDRLVGRGAVVTQHSGEVNRLRSKQTLRIDGRVTGEVECEKTASPIRHLLVCSDDNSDAGGV